MQDLLLAIFIANTFASVIGGGFYLFCRWAERHCSWLLMWVGLFIALGLLAFAFFAALVFPLLLIGLVVFTLGAIFPSAVGGWLHQKSGGASVDEVGAFTLVFFSTFLSCTLGLLIFMWAMYELTPLRRSFDIAEWWGLGGLFIYPSLTPLAVWIWRSLRLRPGLDVPYSDSSPKQL